MMKKILHISILLGAFALSACTNEEANIKEATIESSSTEQSTAINNEANTTKTEEVEPIPLNLTQEQKEDYYQKYVAILEKVNAENSEGFELELEPIKAFLDDDWIEVDDFEKRAKERANMSITVLENSERYSPGSVPKTVKLQIGLKEANIIFEGSFETQLNSNTPDGRQVFSAFNSISSEAENAVGSWTQLGYDESLVDSSTVYNIIVGGKYSQSGIISSFNTEIEFHCNENGAVS